MVDGWQMLGQVGENDLKRVLVPLLVVASDLLQRRAQLLLLQASGVEEEGDRRMNAVTRAAEGVEMDPEMQQVSRMGGQFTSLLAVAGGRRQIP